MTEVLDDIDIKPPKRNSVFYYVSFVLFTILLLMGCAYLQSKDIVDFTPVFEQLPGQLAALSLLLKTIVSYRRVVGFSWGAAAFFGLINLLLMFTAAFQFADLVVGDSHSEILLFWGIITLLYIVLTVAALKFFSKIYDAM